MTTPLYQSLVDEQLEEISAHNLREAYRLAEMRGYYGPPVEQYAEPGYRGRVLQVLRYRVQQQQSSQ
jgi:hypothetical protein